MWLATPMTFVPLLYEWSYFASQVISVALYVYVCARTEAKRCCGILGAGVTGICEMPNMEAGIPTLTLIEQQKFLATGSPL